MTKQGKEMAIEEREVIIAEFTKLFARVALSTHTIREHVANHNLLIECQLPTDSEGLIQMISRENQHIEQNLNKLLESFIEKGAGAIIRKTLDQMNGEADALQTDDKEVS